MPLINGCSVGACKYNYSLMLKEKGNKAQAFAIMANIARDAAHKGQCSPERRRQVLIERRFFG